MSKQFGWPIRIYYDDVDSYGVVYHAHYLKYMARARIEFFRSLGVDLAVLGEQGYLFPVVKAELDFKAPARFNDELLVTTEILHCGRVRIDYLQSISHKVQTDNVLCLGKIRIACTGLDLKPKGLPQKIINLL